jgi:hypothetical protein
MRSGRVNVIGILIVLALAVAGVWCYAFGPYYIHKIKMDRVVKITARCWKDSGLDRCRGQLSEEMVRSEIPEYLDEKDCKFLDGVGGKRTVSCEWSVQENWPFTDYKKTMHFVSEATISPNGVVE